MAGTIVITTLSDGTNSTSATNPIMGSAKAWVNFNGTGTVAIRASYNVSSITDNGTGDYTVNFTTAMPDANYSLVATRSGSSSGSYVLSGNSSFAPTTTAARINNVQPGVGLADDSICSVAIFR
jgi:hypothetical protein